MKMLFDTASLASADIGNAYASLVSREFYDGTLDIEPGGHGALRMVKVMANPISVTHISNSKRVGYERTWAHIRNNKTGLRVIWFVKRGTLTIDRSQGACTIHAGHAGIVDTSTPFRANLMVDVESKSEAIAVLVPSDIFLGYLHNAEQFFDPFSFQTHEGRVVERLLSLMVDELGNENQPELAKSLAGSLLEAVLDCIGCRRKSPPRRYSVAEQRLADIENYILMNLYDSDISYFKVAERCKISPRYLGYLLKANGTSFSELLWKNRLSKARDCLVSPWSRDDSVKTVAYMMGFKSAAHFSRMFKASYGCTPMEYRSTYGTENAASQVLASQPDALEPVALSA